MIFMSNSSIIVEKIENNTSPNYLGINYKYDINILVLINIFLYLFILRKKPKLYLVYWNILINNSIIY
jgi:hypothetical protein